MPSVFWRGERLYVKFKNAQGKWVSQPTAATTKAEAKRIAGDLEKQAERQRLGLEPLPSKDGGGTVAELMTW